MLITIPWNNRTNFLRITLATLKEAMRYGRHDFMIAGHNKTRKDLPDIFDSAWNGHFKEFYGQDCHMLYVDMINEAFQLFPHYSYLLNIDSDVIVHPDLCFAASQAILDLPDAGAIGFFNESCHPEPKEKYKEIYHARNHCSMLGLLINRNAWNDFKKPNPGQQIDYGCIDGMFTSWVAQSGKYRLYTTVRSYVDHIGFKGTHASETYDGIGTFVRARRFYSE